MRPRKLLYVLLTALAVVAGIAAAACGKKPEPEPPQPGPESGAYYYAAGGDEYLVTLGEVDKFVFLYKAETLTGNYKLEGEALTMTPSAEGKEAISATYKDETINFTYDGADMRFLRKVYYKVTFDSKGGSAVQEQPVVNGKTLAKPADPTRDGYRFLGWFTDEGYKTPFAFGSQAVTGNLNLYARWGEVTPGQAEYTARFNLNYENAPALPDVKTIGGKVYDAPNPTREGYTFKGWWASMYNTADNLADKDRLAWQLTADTVLKESVTLFALWEQNGAASGKLSSPLVSVTDTAITISTVSGAASYNLEVLPVDEDSAFEYRKIGGIQTYNTAEVFKDAPAGDYIIKVIAVSSGTGSSDPTVRYYRHKALSRVSVFSVIEPSTLLFNPVEGAERYLITVDCGNKGHKHTLFNNGNSTTYNFVNCEMQEGGIKFVVTAEGSGYASSVSEAFAYDRKLDKVSGLRVDEDTQTLVWNPVPLAASYKVTLNDQVVYSGGASSFSFKNYANGELKFKVQPVTKGYNSPEAVEYTYNKQVLPSPTGLTVNNTVLSWNAVDGANGYEVKIGNQKLTVNEGTSVNLDDGRVNLTPRQEYSITVKALGDKPSPESDPLVTVFGYMSEAVKYFANKVSWQPVIGAASYSVLLNGTEVAKITDGKAYCELSLNRAGENEITVNYFNADEELEGTAQLVVYANTVKFDIASCDPLYLATGDKVNLPSPEREGYNFAGWYNAPGGANGNGAQYKDEYFFEAGDMMLYANWAPKDYQVTLACENGKPNESATVYYNQEFTLSVPTNDDVTLAFIGWYTAKNGKGTKYADENGVSVRNWDLTGGITLYAQWSPIFQFKLQTSDGTYSVTKASGTGPSSVTKMTIPKQYKGANVTTVEGYAFRDLNRLTEINIPDTVKIINTATAFYKCTALRRVNLYATGDTVTPVYRSVDGALFEIYYDEETFIETGIDLVYFPMGRSGRYTIPDGVSSLAPKAFSESRIASITIPASVTEIGSQAFYLCKELTKVNFVAPRLGELTRPLTIANKAFQSCNSLTKITLPARTAEFTESGTNGVFYSCNYLEAIDVEKNGSVYSSIDGFLCNAAGDTMIACPVGKKGEVVIPNGITSIGKQAFLDCKKITGVVIPSFVMSVGESAFSGCAAITSVRFSSSPAKLDCVIGKKAFSGLKALKTVTFDAGSQVVTIGESAFYNCDGLVNFTFPTTLKKIDKEAFNDCEKLEQLNFADGISDLKMGSNVFLKCVALTDVYLPAGVTELDLNVFEGCDNLERITVNENNPKYIDEDGILYTKDFSEILFFPKGRSMEGFVFKDSLIKFGNSVFKNNKNLTSINISNKVEYIGASAFYGCENLEEVTFEAGNDETELVIGASAFQNCTELKSFAFPERVKTINSSVIRGDSGITKLTMGSQVKSIGAYAFYNLSKVTSITLSPVLETIGEYAFYSSSQLTAIEFPNTLKSIGANAFRSSGITSLTLPDSVTEIGANSFQQAKIATLKIGKGITSIPDYAFNNCTDLTSLSIPSTVTYISGKSAFAGLTNLKSLTFEEPAEGEEVQPLEIGVGSTSSGAFSGASDSAFKTLNLPARLTEIGNGAFYGCSSIEEVTFGENSKLTAIGPYAFTGNASSLQSITLPVGLKTIGKNAFKSTDLVNVKIPYTVANEEEVLGIDESAFDSCSSLESVTFEATPEGVDPQPLSLGAKVFNSCTALTTVNLPERLAPITIKGKDYEGILSNTFAGATELSTLTIGSGAANYGVKANILYNKEFSKILFCPIGINTAVVIPNTVNELGEGVFASTKITAVSFEAGGDPLTITDGSSSTGAFYSCTELASVTLPERLTYIGNYAFCKCSNINLKTIIIPANVENIGKYAFQQVPLESVTIPKKVQTIGTSAFAETKLKSIEFEKGAEGEELPDLRIENGYNTSTPTLGGSSSVKAPFTSLEFPARLTYLGKYSVCYADVKTVTFEKGSRLTEVSVDAFGYLDNLVSVDFPDSITTGFCSANDTPFYQSCNSLEWIHFPTGLGDILPFVKGIAKQHDQYSDYTIPIKELRISEDNPNYKSVDGVVYSKDGTKLVYFPAQKEWAENDTECKFVIPDGVTEIGKYAFANQQNMKAVEIPGSVTLIDSGAFEKCTALTSVTFKPGTEDLVFGDGHTALDYHYGANELGVFVGCAALKSLTLPARLVKLGGYAFYDLSNLETITFEANSKLSEIGVCAMSKTGLKSITLPASLSIVRKEGLYMNGSLEKITFEQGSQLKEVYWGAFSYNVKLKAIENIPAGLTVFEKPFANCSALESVTIPKGVTVIDSSSFSGLTSLKSIVIPEGVTEIGDTAFQNCSNLASVTLPSTLTTIGSSAFSGCSSLKELALPNNLISIGASAFSGCSSLKELALPNNLELIGDYTFNNCTALERIEIPGSVKSFGTKYYKLFSGCSSLTEVIVHDGVTLIGAETFKGCTALERVILPNTVATLGNSVFEGCTSLSEVKVAGVETAGTNTFKGCVSLEAVAFSNSLKKIGTNSFEKCTALKRVELGANIEAIPASMFLDCGALTEVAVPGAKIQSVGASAFKNCSNLSEILLSTAEEIGNSAFENCVSLIKFIIPQNATLGTSVFTNCIMLEEIEVLSGNVNYVDIDGVLFNYNKTELMIYPTNRSGKLEIPKTTTAIADGAFKGTPITEITLPEGIVALSASTFEGCKLLTSVTLPSTLTSIGNNAFKNCVRLTSITIPAAVTSIGNYAFSGCVKLNSVTIDAPAENKPSEGLVSIGSYAFQDCALLQGEIVFPKTLGTIGSSAFDGTAIESVTIPKKVKSIGSSAFKDVTSLTTLKFEQDGTEDLSLGSSAFYNTGITEVLLPNRISSFGSYLFQNCEALQKVTFDSVKGNNEFKLGTSAFEGCALLSEVVLPEYVLGANSSCFKDCTNLSSFDYRDDQAFSFGGNMFENCTSLTKLTVYKPCGSLGSSMFKGSGIKTVDIQSESITAIPASLFENCLSLTSFVVPDKVTSIGNYAFKGCSNLATLTMTDKVTSIGQAAFQNCTSLTQMALSEKVTTLSTDLFHGCTNLESVTYSKNLVASGIGRYVFQDCTSLNKIRINNAAGTAGTENLDEEKVGDIEFPANVTKINTASFRGCTSLTKIIMPSKITAISDYSFYGCTNLTTFAAPGLKSISDYAYLPFYDCQFEKFEFLNDGTNGFVVEDLVLYSADKKKVYAMSPDFTGNTPGAAAGEIVYTTPATVEMIGYGAFMNSPLTEVIITDNVKDIKGGSLSGDVLTYSAFGNSKNLKKATLPNNPKLTSVPNQMFYGCSSLIEVNLKDRANINTIGNYAFAGTGFTSFEIPKTIGDDTGTVIRTGAFQGCKNLKEVTFEESTSENENGFISFGDNCFKNCTALTTISLPSRFVNTGSGHGFNSYCFEGCTSLTTVNFADKCDTTSTPSIDKGTFKDCTSLETITIPEYIGSVGNSAFEGCTKLSNVKIKRTTGAFSIGDSAFKNCTALKSVTLPETISKTSLSANLFEGSGITSFNIPDKITSIGANCFKNCEGLTTLDLKNVTVIEPNVFDGCANLISVTGTEVTEVGEEAFINCPKLATISLGGKISTIEGRAFMGTPITTLAVSESLTTIGSQAFKDCANLATLTLGNSVTTIGASAFENCTALKSLNLPSITTIGAAAFKNCGLTQIVLTRSVLTLSPDVFEGWTAEQQIYVTNLNKAPMNWEEGWSGNAEVLWNQSPAA